LPHTSHRKLEPLTIWTVLSIKRTIRYDRLHSNLSVVVCRTCGTFINSQQDMVRDDGAAVNTAAAPKRHNS
jgi:hypothetical protein